MSRPIFSPVAALELGVSSLPPVQAERLRHRTFTPGQRIVDGRVFYSAAWLDPATNTGPEPRALTHGRDAGPDPSASDDLSERKAGVAPAGVRGVDG